MPYSSIIKEITENIARGKLDEALSKIKIIIEGTENQETYFHALYYESKIDLINSDFHNALDKTKRCLKIAEKEKFHILTAKALSLQAFASMSLGKLDDSFSQLATAEVQLEKSQTINEYDTTTLNNIFGNIYNTKALIHWKKGDLMNALEWHEKALSYRTQLPKKLEVAISLANIGTVYRDLFEYEQALEYYQAAYKIKKNLGNKRSISRILFYIIHTAVLNNNHEVIEKYHPILKSLSTESNEFIRLNCRMADALILKNHKRLRQKMESEKIFSQIVEKELINPHLTLLAMKHLCEIYLDEFNLYGEEEVLNAVNELLNGIKRITEDIGLFSNYIVALILQSKLNLLKGELDKASELLEEAETISKENNLVKRIQEVKHEKEMFETTYKGWKDKVFTSDNIHQRMQKSEIMKYITYAQQVSGIKFNE
ncbi:MAG: tetratricopeptide repeat protein [Candidatus Kariarchaeaceae archaeon]|jgi:tetratricopeptide (TPR) repeat protein